ncbi:NPP1 family protein [Pseudomonas oryzihabitans]|uniref:Necrosis and ethylene inducing protein n=1 Tax=Pseudomonas oryzihabitans TaxID=47885 RepID=A0ABX3IT49_9PSED|nr:NPP1 family protein [Pseudomonas psychrotolerans]ONN71039.1 hypothetical protein BVL52_11035 [Pseudomonas psychrotolerans]
MGRTISLLLGAVALYAMPDTFAATVGHDDIKQIAASATDIEFFYQPMISDGRDSCNNYPAVDAFGNVGGGLNPSGAPDGNCRGTNGQVYSRMVEYHNHCAIMYSWYFPKDQPPNYLGIGPGHRHDWENIVVWTYDCKVGSPVVKVDYSTHGKYRVNYAPPVWRGGQGYLVNGVHPKVTYHATYSGFADHSLDYTQDMGRNQPLISWSRMPLPAKNALNGYDFGAANVPFKDGGDFWSNLEKAWNTQ